VGDRKAEVARTGSQRAAQDARQVRQQPSGTAVLALGPYLLGFGSQTRYRRTHTLQLRTLERRRNRHLGRQLKQQPLCERKVGSNARRSGSRGGSERIIPSGSQFLSGRICDCLQLTGICLATQKMNTAVSANRNRETPNQGTNSKFRLKITKWEFGGVGSHIERRYARSSSIQLRIPSVDHF
jgi:hypothetical protein